MNRYTIRYEFQNTLHNVYAVFFGSIFPVLLLHMIVRGTLGDIPKNMKDEVVTTIFIGMAMLIPLASIFLNHAAIYSNELDKIKTDSYDMVLNGYEIGGGSIRIHEEELQEKVFEKLGLSKEEQQDKFGFFLEVLKYGVPPHGGLAFGIDRWLMAMLKENSIKEVIP